MSRLSFPGLATILAAILAAIFAAPSPAAAQTAVDPIGRIAPTGRFEGGAKVQVGRDAAGRTVCFVREEGDSHRLDIGIGAAGAFVRLETPEPRDSTPVPPVRVYAGLQQTENGRATDRFMMLKPYDGEVAYVAAIPGQGSFTLLAASAPEAFLAVVAAAAGNFLVIEQRRPPVRDYVAIYEFNDRAAAALAACRQRHGL
jgi:hypothetical protein